MGTWEGKTHDYLNKHYTHQIHSFWNTLHLYRSEDGEDFSDVCERVHSILKRIAKENDDGNILLVTHSIIIKCMFAVFKGKSIEKLWDPPYIHDTSLSVVQKKLCRHIPGINRRGHFGRIYETKREVV